jgi:hypothetical protein
MPGKGRSETPGYTVAPYTVALSVFASPSSSPRFLARYAETFALFMQRSEQ